MRTVNTVSFSDSLKSRVLKGIENLLAEHFESGNSNNVPLQR